MPFDFFKKSKTEPKPETLNDAPREELSPEERAYLEKLEQKLKSDVNFEDPASVDAELRRRERERLEKTYRPYAPLYPGSDQPSSGAGAPRPANGQSRSATSSDSRPSRSFQNDPRYREYFERLKRETSSSRPTSKYDEEVKPTSLEELDRQGWSSRPRSSAGLSGMTRPFTPAPVTPPPTARAQATPPPPGDFNPIDLQPGVLMCFDDGSVAAYKDAVSGKDYALFYFLERDGTLAPRGIFLEQYGKQKIGQLPLSLFNQMIERKRWERDAVIFHLDQYHYASLIPVSQGESPTGRPATGFRSTTSTGGIHTPVPRERRPSTQSDVHDSWTGRSYSSSGPRRDALLERGRVLRINVGGRIWESVYWTEDEIGPIVAHNTNKVWALMHLDLNRFKDSLEYGDVLSYEELSEIEHSLATQGR